MAERLPYSPPWRLEGGEPADVAERVGVEVTFTWKVEQPIFKAWSGATRPTAWSRLRIAGVRNDHAEDLRIEGRGWTVKKDGTIGAQPNEGRFLRLADLPNTLADQMLVAWLKAANAAGRTDR